MRIINRRRALAGMTVLSTALFAAQPSFADDKDPLRFYDNDGFMVRGHFEAGLNAVAESNLFWDFAATVAPAANYNPNKQWLEGYVKPGLSWSKSLDQYLTAYGKVSGVASGTQGLDAFEAGNSGRATLEEAYVGLRAGNPDGRSVDVSIGPREFKAGTGMLIANGGTSGFERGALKLGPRKAWEFAALGRVAVDSLSATGFLIDPNELPTSNTSTSIAGADFRYDGAPGNFAGLTLGHVTQSTAPYPKAAPGGIGHYPAAQRLGQQHQVQQRMGGMGQPFLPHGQAGRQPFGHGHGCRKDSVGSQRQTSQRQSCSTAHAAGSRAGRSHQGRRSKSFAGAGTGESQGHEGVRAG